MYVMVYAVRYWYRSVSSGYHFVITRQVLSMHERGTSNGPVYNDTKKKWKGRRHSNSVSRRLRSKGVAAK